MSANRIDALPAPWHLGNLKWHIFILYRSDGIRVIDLYDSLIHCEYRVCHLQHTAAKRRFISKIISQSASAILIRSSNEGDQDWYRQHEDALSREKSSRPSFQYISAQGADVPAWQGLRLLRDRFGPSRIAAPR